MIVEKSGRRRSQKTAIEAAGDLERQMEGLNEEERDLLFRLLEEMEYGETETLKELHRAHYEEPPVSVRKFLTDPYYLGVAGEMLYPKLRDDLIELLEGDYDEAVATGSIGFGKSTLAEFAILRQIYEFGVLKDPQATFGVMPGTEIIVGIVSVNLTQAKRGMFNGVIQKMARSPYFQTKFKGHIKPSDGEIIFPKNIRIVCGSPSSEQLIGLNVLGAVIDESNFLDKGLSSTKKAAHARQDFAKNANALYRSIVRRMKSRFMHGGIMPGVLLLVSSKGTVGSFTELRISAARNNQKIFVREYATWDVKPESQFTGRKFPVLVGDELIMSSILNKEDVPAIEDSLTEPGRTATIQWVPEEYREDFETDLDAAIRDIAGVATQSIRPFITRRSKIRDAMDPKRAHPFSKEVYVLGENEGFLWNRLCEQIARRVKGGFTERGWQPLRSPGSSRHIHIDTSLGRQDALGLAMGYISRWRDVERKNRDGSRYMELAPEIELDFYLRIEARPGEEIILGDIRGLIYDLVAHGFQVELVTTDRFQYADTHQKLKARGIEAEILSLDTSPRGYEHLKAALYEDRLKLYHYEPLRRELIDLEVDPVTGKVDHPPVGSDGEKGSKDVSDAVAGVVCSLTERAPGRPLGVGVIQSNQEDWVDGEDDWVLGRNGRRAKIVEPEDDHGVFPTPFLFGDGE